jgi:putative copper export protein/methionine-rich copper-binding protein CopC
MPRSAGIQHSRFSPRSLAPLVIALVAVMAMPSPGAAHQFLRGSTPSAGDTLSVVPGEVRLTFSERVRLEFTEVVVQGPDGALVLATLRQSADDDRVLVAPIRSGWHSGDFTIRWTTVGADGHRTDGTVSFTVAEGAEGLPAPEPQPEETTEPEPVGTVPHHDPRMFPETPTFGAQSPAYAGIRALLFMALVAALGAVALRWIVLPVTAQRQVVEADAMRTGLDRGAAGIGFLAAIALLVAALARLWAQSASLFGTAGALDPGRLAQALTLQPWAMGWWLQAAAAVGAIIGFGLARRAVRGGWLLAVVAVLVAAVTPALSGHAVAMSGIAWLAVPADTLHVLAAGGWLGSLFALVVVGLPTAMRLGEGRRGAAAAALVHGFSPTALVFAGVLVTTGVISAWLHLGEIPALWTTPYGRTLLLKVGIFSGVAVIGAYNLLRVRPALGDARGAVRLRRSGTAELLLALAVIVVTAILVAVPPPAQ